MACCSGWWDWQWWARGSGGWQQPCGECGRRGAPPSRECRACRPRPRPWVEPGVRSGTIFLVLARRLLLPLALIEALIIGYKTLRGTLEDDQGGTDYFANLRAAMADTLDAYQIFLGDIGKAQEQLEQATDTSAAQTAATQGQVERTDAGAEVLATIDRERRVTAFRLKANADIRVSLEQQLAAQRDKLAVIGLESAALDRQKVAVALLADLRKREVAAQQKLAGLQVQVAEADHRRRADLQLQIEQAEDELAAISQEVARGVQPFLELIERLAAGRERLRLATEEQRRLAGAIQSVAQAGGKAMEDMITGAERASEVMRQLIREIATAILRAQVIKPLVDALGSGLNSFFGIETPAPGAATGGFRQGLVPVGERGPELVDFRTPGRVYTTGQLGGALAGAGAGIGALTINVQSSDGPGVRAAIAQSLPAIADAANSKLLQESTRPGLARRLLRQ